MAVATSIMLVLPQPLPTCTALSSRPPSSSDPQNTWGRIPHTSPVLFLHFSTHPSIHPGLRRVFLWWVLLGEPALAAADPYRVLGVSPAASAAEIKAAYRALVKQHHPDAGGDHRTILELNAAWEVLRNSERRRGYDNLNAPGRQAGPTPSAGPAPVCWPRPSVHWHIRWCGRRDSG